MPVIEVRKLFIYKADSLSPSQQQEMLSAFGLMRQRPMGTVSNEIHQPDRRALDDIIFDALKLSKGEREAVYEAVVNLVEKRLQKAGSLKVAGE